MVEAHRGCGGAPTVFGQSTRGIVAAITYLRYRRSISPFSLVFARSPSTGDCRQAA
jgi:hypothetical protein